MTKEDVLIISKGFKTKTEFHNKARKYFDFAKNEGFFEEAVSHMEKVKKSKIDKNYVVSKIKEYDTVNEFRKKEKTLYNWIQNNHLGKELLCYFNKSGNLYKRCIYVYEFEDKSCYVGLTFNLKIRDIQHNNDEKSEVFKYHKKSGLVIPNPKQLTDYVDVNEAIKLEGFFCEKYRNDGWNILNIAKTGGIGALDEKKQYTKEYCKLIALNYKTRKEFENENKYLYNKIRTHKWGNYVFEHMKKEVSDKIKSEKIRKSKLGKKMNIKDKKQFCTSHSKHPVQQFDKDYVFIKEYCSANEAAREINGFPSGIINSCKNENKTYKGFFWRYKEKYNVKKYIFKKENNGNKKSVLQYDKNGNFIKKFNSAIDAAKALGHVYSSYNIGKCCKGKIKYCLGYIWKYEK